MEDPQDVHRAIPGVLDAVHLVGWQMEAGTRAQRKRAAADMGDPRSGDDVADLVIGVALEGRLARLDDSHELRHVEAARVLVDEISEAPLDRSLELWLLVEADGHPTFAAGLRTVLGREHGKHAQVLRAGVLDDIGLAWREIDAHVGLELVRASIEVEPSPAVHDVQDLLLSGELPLRRPAGPEVDHAVFQALAAVGGIESHSDSRRVAVVLNGFEIVLVDHETGDSRHRWNSRSFGRAGSAQRPRLHRQLPRGRVW